MKKINGILYALLSSAAFGFMPIFARTAYNHGSNTLTVLSLRFLSAALILISYFLFSKTNFKINRKQFIILFLVGILGYTSTGITLFLSYNYISVGMATTLHFIYPAFVILLNFLIYREAFVRNKIIALLLSTAGVYTLIGINSSGIHIGGCILAMLSGLTFSGCVMGMNHPEVKNLSNTVTVFYFSIFAGIALMLLSIFTGQFQFSIDFYSVGSIVGIALISTILSISLFVKAIKIIGASSSSILGTFEPIVSIILGIVLYNEKLNITTISGTLLILASVIVLANEK